ncbi:MAG TPA: glycosyltransferase family 1 protein, partial [Proteobacteria bacterium]|nr:glycosyltransferase family 1 protein [Pseudomonadota bacterium]
MERMRVLFAFHTRRASGAEIVMKRALAVLVRRGLEPYVCAPHGEVIDVFSDVARGSLAADGIYPPRPGDVVRLVKFTRGRGIDVLWANSPKAAPIVALAARFSGRPSVWAVHDIVKPSAKNRLFFRTMSTAFAQVVAVSEATRRRLVELGVSGKKIVVARPGIDVDGWRALARNGHRTDGLLERPAVLMVGAITRWKGQHILLDAARALLGRGLHANFYLAGDIIDDSDIAYRGEILEAISSPPLRDRVHYLGKRDDIPGLIAAADIVVHASCEPDPFPTVITESLVLGKPVVASRIGGVPEQIEDGKTGLLFEPNDAMDLALKLSRLLVDGEFRADLGRRAIESSDRFRIEPFAESVFGAIRD